MVSLQLMFPGGGEKESSIVAWLTTMTSTPNRCFSALCYLAPIALAARGVSTGSARLARRAWRPASARMES
jgi:hypothetical protein